MTDVSVVAARVVSPVAQPAPQATRRAPAVRRSDGLLRLRRFSLRLSNEWLPRVVWSASRTGRAGLVGLALVAASGVFYLSTHVPIAAEVAALKSELATAQARAASGAPRVASEPAAIVHNLPKRADMPAMLGLLFEQANAARLSIDTGKYEMTSAKTGDVVRYKVSFPVSGSYPQVRQFIDATLKAMPAVAISELSLERKAIGDGVVEAQIRLTVFTRGTS
jgi:Tfp pilus assembly protein PilO